MRTGQLNFSIPLELQERIENLISKGERSKVVCKLLSEYCDRLDAEKGAHKVKQIWFDKTIKPFIKKFVGNSDLFSHIENGKLQPAFRKAGITISDADIKLCIEQIIVEGES